MYEYSLDEFLKLRQFVEIQSALTIADQKDYEAQTNNK